VALTKITGEGVGDVDSLTVGTTSSGEFNALTISQANNTSGNESRIRFKRTTDGGADREVAAIVADRVGGNDTALVFETNTDGSDGSTERVRITQDGKVGIGTSDPDESIHCTGAIMSTGVATTAVASSSTFDFTSGNMRLITRGADTSTRGGLQVISQASNGGSSISPLVINTAGQIATGNGTVDSSRCNVGTLVVNADTTGSSETQIQVRAPQNTDSTVRNYVLFYRNDGTIIGNIGCNNSSTAYNTSSDYRLKEHVADMTGAIARVKKLSPKRFSWIVDELDAANVDGFLAHEAQTVVPEAVHGTHNQVDDAGEPVYQAIDQSKLIPLLTAALKESISKVETLETEMTALKARVTALEDA